MVTFSHANEVAVGPFDVDFSAMPKTIKWTLGIAIVVILALAIFVR
jgi:hypothetical protein